MIYNIRKEGTKVFIEVDTEITKPESILCFGWEAGREMFFAKIVFSEWKLTGCCEMYAERENIEKS